MKYSQLLYSEGKKNYILEDFHILKIFVLEN